jgi:hypothetical protein
MVMIHVYDDFIEIPKLNLSVTCVNHSVRQVSKIEEPLDLDNDEVDANGGVDNDADADAGVDCCQGVWSNEPMGLEDNPAAVFSVIS